MRGICAIVLGNDKIFISSARLRRNHLTFLEEVALPLAYNSNNFIAFLRDNSDVIERKIRRIEEKFSIRIEKVFLELPWDQSVQQIVEEVIPLKRKKRITADDISWSKKYLEDKFLDWDDICIHNVAMSYEVAGQSYGVAPLGVLAKRIRLRSLLVGAKHKAYKEVEDIFNNINRNFGGFVTAALSSLATTFRKKGKTQVVVNINYGSSSYVIRDENNDISYKEFNFSLKKAIEILAKRFMMPIVLASEVFQRYISFKEIPYFKEITLKTDQGYINLSIQTLNSFVKEYIGGEIKCLVGEIKDQIKSNEVVISFIGRLNTKEGFYNFLKEYVPYSLSIPLSKAVVSSSLGCLNYGVKPFLENDHKENNSVFRRILDIYREYF